MAAMKFLVLSTCLMGALAVDFQITCKAGGDIWVGILGNPGQPNLEGGGFVCRPNEPVTVSAPDNWQGRFWARTWCNVNGDNHCATGDCGNKLQCDGAGGAPPATLIEITLKGDGGLDYYDVSLVDGFNVPASIEPADGQGDGSQYSCTLAGCSHNINEDCPGPLQLTNENGVIACKSACLAFDTDQYCCRGDYDESETCKSTDWPENYPAFFKDRCPDAYSYAYDDHKSIFTCQASSYRITFG